MSDYQGFFVRDVLGQTPGQTGSSFSSSPDVILAGTTPPPDSAQYTTPAGYATDFGSTVYLQAPNYVYLRALNATTGPATGRAWFYWLESNLALWPQLWRGDMVEVAGNAANFQDIAATAAGEVCIPDLPFQWTPPAPSSGQHYCLINWMENPPVSSPPASPVAGLPPFTTYDQLANFVLSHPNMAWRNTVDVAGLGYTWTQTTAITGPSEPTPFNIGIQCTNMPTDGQVGFQVPGPTPGLPSVVYPVSPIVNPNLLIQETVSGWPPNATTSITVEYRQGATTPPPGSSITVIMTIPVNSLSEGTRALVQQAPPHLVVRPTAEAAEHSFVLGTVTYRF